MALLLDVGNTAVTYGVYGSGRLIKSGSALCIDIPKLVKIWSRSGTKCYLDHLVISSVVPKNTLFLKYNLKPYFSGDTLIAGLTLPVPIKHKYKQIKQLGIDRAVNIYGAVKMGRLPLLVIDFGTAITFDYVSQRGVFEGGMIVPGPELSFQALIQRAAQLPKNARLPRKSSSFLGRTTYDCMTTGILEGYGALTDGLIERFRTRHGRMKTLATGGFACHLKPHTRRIDIFDGLHSIKSLAVLYKDWLSRTAR